MKRALVTFLIGASLASLCQAQPATTKARLIFWPVSANAQDPSFDLRDPQFAIPMVRDDEGSVLHLQDRGGDYTLADDPQFAADTVYNKLVADNAAGWMTKDFMNVFIRFVGQDIGGGVNDAPGTLRGDTWLAGRAFFYPNDRIPGLSDVGAAGNPLRFFADSDDRTNRAYRHPFLRNATVNSPLAAYMRTYAQRLASHLNDSNAPAGLRNGSPIFVFDNEHSHIIMAQRNEYNTVRMMYILMNRTDISVGGGPSVNIWSTWKVPGSPGWVPPQDSELFQGTGYANGFANTTGKTLSELYDIEQAKHSGDIHWPAGQTALKNYIAPLLISPQLRTPDQDELRPIMLWWYEVCAKAEAAVWENAITKPLVESFPGCSISSYNFMHHDGKVDESRDLHDIGQLGQPSSDSRVGDDAPLVNKLPRLQLAQIPSHWMWQTGGPIDPVDGTQRRWAFCSTGENATSNYNVTNHLLDSPELYSSGAPFFIDSAGGGRQWREENPSLPSYAQLPRDIATQAEADAIGRGDLFREFHRYADSMLYRHTIESSINSDSIDPDTGLTRFGGREAKQAPWINQRLVASEAGWFEFSEESRQIMSLLRAEKSPTWLIFVDSPPEGYDYVLPWRKTVDQRDQVFNASVTSYEPLTGVELTANDPDRMNDVVRRVQGSDTVPGTYDAKVQSSSTIHGPVSDLAGRSTRTIVDVTLAAYAWNDHCIIHALAVPPPPSNINRPARAPQSGLYEINVETVTTWGSTNSNTSPGTLFSMACAWNYQYNRWDPLPLKLPAYYPTDATKDGRPIYSAAVRRFPVDTSDPSTVRSIKTRRTYVLREPVYSQSVDAQYVEGDLENQNHMTLKIVQYMNGAVVDSLTTATDLVQVVPVCATDAEELNDNAMVPYDGGPHNGTMSSPTEVEDALLSENLTPDQVVQVQIPVHIDVTEITHCPTCRPGVPTILNSAFSHISPQCESGGPCYSPSTIYMKFPYWVRMDDADSIPVFISKLDSEDATFNYGSLMHISIRHANDGTGPSAYMTIEGNGTTLLMPGSYEVRPMTSESGGIIAPLIDSGNAASKAVWDFSFRFDLLSDCNLNGIDDAYEIEHQFDSGNPEVFRDVWPMDGLIDACHPEECEADYNGDGVLDQGDVDTLIAMIGGNSSGAAPNANPDFNADGVADQGDVDALIDTVAGHGCPNQ